MAAVSTILKENRAARQIVTLERIDKLADIRGKFRVKRIEFQYFINEDRARAAYDKAISEGTRPAGGRKKAEG